MIRFGSPSGTGPNYWPKLVTRLRGWPVLGASHVGRLDRVSSGSTFNEGRAKCIVSQSSGSISHPSHSHTPRPMTCSKSLPCSHGSSCVNKFTASL